MRIKFLGLFVLFGVSFSAYSQDETVNGDLRVDGDIAADGNLEIKSYSPRIFLKRDTDIGGFIQGVQTQFKDGSNNFYFGNIHSNEWVISKGAYNGARLFTVESNGNVGIGTTAPIAKLDVGTLINNEVLGTVFGRLNEGNGTGDGTFLGVKGYGTQLGQYGGKSFGIVHSFYGEINSSINFHRGASTTGGYVTINTSDNTEQVRVTNNGNVGIGTASPDTKLEIRGDQNSIPTLGTAAQGQFKIKANNNALEIGVTNVFNGRVASLQSRHSSESYADNFGKLLLNPLGGQVGVGTSDMGSHKLAVEGSIGAREIKVEATGWSDFVFEKDYNLPTLKEVEEHIYKKGHLQDIPSAADVKENGIFLGEMDSKLLQKIEELTLYTIQQEKEIERLKLLEERLFAIEELLKIKK